MRSLHSIVHIHIYISLAQKMSREHLWVMQSLAYRFKNKTPHGMHYCRDCPYNTW